MRIALSHREERKTQQGPLVWLCDIWYCRRELNFIAIQAA